MDFRTANVTTKQQELVFEVVPDTIDVEVLEPKTPRNTPVKQQTATVIKDRAVLEEIKRRLLSDTGTYSKRNYLIFLFALNTGLRMGDVLTTRIQDVWNTNTNTVKEHTAIFEEKTNKIKDLFFSDAMKEALTDYITSLGDVKDGDPLFPSRKHGIRYNTYDLDKDNTDCLTRQSYWRIIHTIGKQLGIEHLSCHSTRKSWAYAIYESYKGKLVADQYSALDIVQKMLNHSSSNVTLRYIGIDDDITKEVMNNIVL